MDEGVSIGRALCLFYGNFNRLGGAEAIGKLFDEKEREPIVALLTSALKRRKAEAAVVTLLSDVFGFGKDEAVWLAAVMQVTWAAIIGMDDVIDFHPERDKEPTMPIVEGVPNAIEKPLFSMLMVINKVVKKRLGGGAVADSFTEMLTQVYRGDLAVREIGWDRARNEFVWDYDISKYERANREIAAIFSWFAECVGEIQGFPKAGEELSGFMEDLGYFVLLANDMEDIRSESQKHERGNDIGRKVSLPWRLMMEIDGFEKDKACIKEAFAQIGKKRSKGEALDPGEEEMFQRALEIGQKHLPEVIRMLEPSLGEAFFEARKKLANAFDLLPGMDERNKFVFRFLDGYLDRIWRQMQRYKEKDTA